MKYSTLPKSISYLKPYLEFLDSLPPEEIEEDTDVRILDEVLLKRSKDAGDDWEEIRDEHVETFQAWLEEDQIANGAGYYVLPFLMGYDPEYPLMEIEEEAKNLKSGLSLAISDQIVSIEDEYGSLNVTLKNNVHVSFLVRKKEYGGQDPVDFEIHRKNEENQFSSVRLGKWTGSKLVLLQTKSFFWKSVVYHLEQNGTHVDIQGGTMGEDFDDLIVDEVISQVEISEVT